MWDVKEFYITENSIYLERFRGKSDDNVVNGGVDVIAIGSCSVIIFIVIVIFICLMNVSIIIIMMVISNNNLDAELVDIDVISMSTAAAIVPSCIFLKVCECSG